MRRSTIRGWAARAPGKRSSASNAQLLACCSLVTSVRKGVWRPMRTTSKPFLFALGAKSLSKLSHRTGFFKQISFWRQKLHLSRDTHRKYTCILSRRFCMRLLVFLVIRTNRIPTQMSVCAYQYRMTNTVSINISRQKKIIED